MTGLRQRQSERTRQSIQDTATRLFLESGFEAVNVNDIAAAAEVSKRTLFKYFPTKEDLVIGSFSNHQNELARLAAAFRQSDILAALERHFLYGLDQRDPITGLDDRPQTLTFVAMVLATPSLQSRLLQYQTQAEEALTRSLGSRVAAYVIFAVHRALADENRRCLNGGISAEQRYPDAVDAAKEAFKQLREGLTRPEGTGVHLGRTSN
ncbi:TetR/AcrR family transcriptional regulator [Dactylosporangium sp. CS-033363]|uniref:TetR/AcrR family transcriptional regulator n=1 Tax=Dactylosporangium sp. CS-033363 TaxID=3239935 RepID=UPI003D8DC851